MEKNNQQDTLAYNFEGNPGNFATKAISWLHLIGFPDLALNLEIVLSQNRYRICANLFNSPCTINQIVSGSINPTIILFLAYSPFTVELFIS